MKKQNTGKKPIKWIILAIALVVAAIGVALALTVFGGNSGTQSTPQTTPTEPTLPQPSNEIKLCWNVDREDWLDDKGNNMRVRVGEYYRLRFAVDGEQKDFFFENFALVEKADDMLFMGLVADENDVVKEVLDVHEFTGGLTAYEYYVKEVGETEIKLNSVASMKGLDWVLRITPETQVYNVGGTGLLVGLPGKVEVGSCVYAVMDENGYTTHIFVMPPFEEKPVYWNIERKYDSTGKVTTRERDSLGYFTFLFAVNGEQVELRTMDVDVASQVDSFAAKCMHLEFNEDGTIAEAVHARLATGGNSVASWYHVLEINTNESSFYAKKFSGSDKGSEASPNWHNDVKIFDCSGKGKYVGEPTTLQLYDQIHCLSNPYGQVTVIFIVSRPVDSALYYNLDRKWDSSAKVSTRTPAADGYYYIEFSVEGQRVTLRTQDPAVVNTIDGRAAKVLGFELEGDVILKAYAPGSVAGSNTTAFDYSKVTKINTETGEITTTRNGNTYIAKMTETTKIYDVSANAVKVGEKTTLRVGDTVYGLADLTGKLTSIFVTSRQNVGPLYWNLDRNYDSATKTTKRKPAEDGYYYIALSNGTTTKTFKTMDKSLVNTLDSYVACGVVASGDVLYKVYKYDTIVGYTGGGYASWTTVTSVNGRSFTSKDTKSTYSGYAGGKIYDVSQGSKAPVTETILRVGDRIHAVRDANKNIVLTFVVNRPVQAEMYYNLERLWDADNGTTTRQPDGEGYYVFKMAYNGGHVEVKTKDIAIANVIDGRTAKVLGLDVTDGIINKAYLPSQVAATATTAFDYTDVVKIEADGTIVTTRNGKEYIGKPAADCKVFNVASNAKLIGETSKVAVGDKLYGFSDKDGLVTYIYIINKTVETETKTAMCQVCGEEVTWKSWDGAMSLAAGHWYLNQNVTVSKTAEISKDKNVCLDLCGYDIVGAETLDRILNIYGNFNLMDEKKADGTFDGDIIANYNNASGRTGSVFYVQNSASAGYGVFCMYGGNLKATGQTKNGGIGGIGNDFYMYDGTISGGTAAQNGGNIYMENNADALFVMLGGTISGGTAKSGVGGGVRGSNPITLGGTAKITGNNGSDLFLLSTETITISAETPFAEGAMIGLTLENGFGTFAKEAQEGDETYFDCASGEVIYADGELSVAAAPVVHEDHCICGGVGELGDHTCQDVAWEPWTGTVADGGCYILTADTAVTASINIPKDTTVSLCLNGHKLTGTVRMLDISGTLNLCDHTGEGSISSTVVKMAPIFYVRDGGTFNFFGGKLVGSNQTQAGVGAISDSSSAAVNGTMNMYGGQIIGAKVTNGGGALQTFHKSVLTVYGGTIFAGEAATGSAIATSTASTLNLLGGVISGGTGSKGSIHSQGTLVLGGNVQISGGETNLYVLKNKTVMINDLADDAMVYVTMEAGSGVFATNAYESDVDCFKADNGAEITLVGDQLTMGAAPFTHEDHCICGGTGELGDHTCENVTWTPWTGTVADGGHYVLTKDISVSASINIPKNTTVSLCLNGHKITGSVRVLDISGTLNLCDHTGKGSISSTVVKMAPIFYVRDGGTINFFGGKLQGSNQTQAGVGALADKVGATMNIYGGQIVGAKVTNGGGAIQAFHSSTLNIYGGTIVGGEAATGSAIATSTASTLNLLGGTVTGGTGAAGSINAQGVVNLGGNVQISGGQTNLYIRDGKTVSIGDLTDDAMIYVTMAAGTGEFATDAVEADAEFFKADNGNEILFADGKLSIGTEKAPEPQGHQDHCICGGLGVKGDHTACSTVTWEPFAGTWEKDKNYYLTEDLNITATVTIAEGSTVHLCLNGFNVKGGTGVNRVFNVYGSLSICDHKQSDGTYKGTVQSNYTGTAAKYGSVVYVQNKSGASFALFGGNLITTATVTDAGGVICTDRAVTIYDGTISGGNSSKNGGSISIQNANANVKLYGGTISGGNANAGGNIYASSGKLLIDGCTIENGVAYGSGGNLNVQGSCQVEIKSGTISGGKSTDYNGGNIHVTGGSVTLSGGTVSGGEALTAATGGNGGNIYANGGTFKMEGGIVTGGKAVNGGNLNMKINGASISGGTIYGGTATNGGDIYFEKSGGTLTVSGLIESMEQLIHLFVKQGNLVTSDLDPATKLDVVFAQ